MANIQLQYLPGVCKVNSAYASSTQAGYVNGRLATGRFTNMNGTVFINGYPEKIGGWQTNISTPVTGVPRGIHDWRDFSTNIYLGIGTNSKLQYLNNGTLTDITPWRGILTGTLTNPYTTNGTTTVEVTHTGHGLVSGDYVMLTSSAPITGITVSGVFNPITKIDANNYTVVVPTAAGGSASGGGGTVSYVYYRITVSNPFTTTISSTSVKVTQTANGVSIGDYVTIAGASSIGGITPAGEVQVATIIDNNNWTFNWTSPATSSAGPGGGTPNFQYDINVGNIDTSTVYGYGTGGNGTGGYGQNSTIGISTPPRVWSLQNYGQQLLSSPYGGGIYIWDPIIGGRSYPMYNAPTNNLFMLVTSERFVFSVGNTTNYLQVQSSDQQDYTQWTAALNNTAFSRTLQNGSYCVGGIVVRDEVVLIFTNDCCYLFNYSGDQYFYDSSTQAVRSGLIAPLACATLSGVAYWMSQNEFWMWNGSVQALPSDDIRDYVFQNINLTQAYKCCSGTNISKKQVIFFYVSSSATEIDSYVIYHIDQNCFSTGTVLQRTSWIDRGLFQYPQSVDVNGYIYNQESGVDANGMPIDSYIVFSPVDISKGDRRMDIFSFIPDFERQSGNISLTINTQNYPEDAITPNGPYTLAPGGTTPRVDIRLGAKLAGYKMESNILGGDWRLGVPRIEGQPAGARR